jgi:hypothetical protein
VKRKTDATKNPAVSTRRFNILMHKALTPILAKPRLFILESRFPGQAEIPYPNYERHEIPTESCIMCKNIFFSFSGRTAICARAAFVLHELCPKQAIFASCLSAKVPFSLSLTFRVHELDQTFHELMQSSIIFSIFLMSDYHAPRLHIPTRRHPNKIYSRRHVRYIQRNHGR